MSSEEEDYMSEAFLAKCVPTKDIIPGLIKNPSLKRQHDMWKQKMTNPKRHQPIRKIEAERREQGLQESICSNNKGFTMLQKMGYKPGQGIGKEESGISEPITITVKADRFGLGRASVLKEISQLKNLKRANRIKQHKQMCNVEDYRQRLYEKAQEKDIIYDLNKSQRVCENLDTQKDIQKPDEVWFWPEKIPENNDAVDSEEVIDSDDDADDEDVHFEPSEKLKLITDYLRICHLYCIWCGTQYNNQEDMISSCPGPTRDVH